MLAFYKDKQPYAVKFLPGDRAGPLARFRDEYFCAAQIPSHINVTRAYHLDRVSIEGSDYYLIVMKRYQSSLYALGSISNEDDTTKAERGWNLLRALCDGIEHLHNNGIVHRDIKPQNIFFDHQEKTFVVGDLGIAHFSDELFVREAKTIKSDRLANFACCAPEQVVPGTPAASTMDIFALGQVLNWYIRDSFVRGGGRKSYAGKNEELALLDKIIDKCIQDAPEQRFQTVSELRALEHKLRHPARDIWQPLTDLDGAFRSSIPKIPEFYQTDDKATIDRFLLNFAKQCHPKEFWYVLSDGGDNVLGNIRRLENERWLLHGIYECKVSTLICYKHRSEWQSFFVLLIGADEPFVLTDPDGEVIPRQNMAGWSQDVATFYEGRYMDTEDADNGYFLYQNEMVPIDSAKVRNRIRFLKSEAFLIVPATSGAVRSTDRTPNEVFLKDVLMNGATDMEKVRTFLEATIRYTDQQIKQRL